MIILEEGDRMNNDVRKLFYQYYRNDWHAKGFYKKNNTCFRIINDIVQNFTLEHYSMGYVCRISFGILPLSMGINDITQGEEYELEQFDVEPLSQPSSWAYDKKSEDDCIRCFENILYHINKYLFPFFDQAVDSKSALAGKISIEKLFNNNRLAVLKMENITDGSRLKNGINLNDDTKFYLALSAQDYDFALQCRKVQLPSRRDHVSCEKEIDLLERKEYAYFQDLIKRNEKISWEYLTRFHMR